MVRGTPASNRSLWPEAEMVIADAANPVQLRQVFDGVDTAYYLIHSLHLCPKDAPFVGYKGRGGLSNRGRGKTDQENYLSGRVGGYP